ncbi:MAG: hypothetical protein Q9225_001590 [Loekoesia sp. 1 TL-2023]
MSQDLEGNEILENGYPKYVESKQVVAVSGLEPAHEDKQVISVVVPGLEPAYEDKQVTSVASGPPEDAARPSSSAPRKLKAVLRHRRGRWALGGILTLILFMAIAIPVGVIQSRKKRPSVTRETTFGPSTSNTSSTVYPTAVPNATLSGALKGTRLATMDPRTGGDIYLYYQATDGGLHYISQSPARIWQGSMNLRITNAKLGTPLCTTYTSTNGSVVVSSDGPRT